MYQYVSPLMLHGAKKFPLLSQNCSVWPISKLNGADACGDVDIEEGAMCEGGISAVCACDTVVDNRLSSGRSSAT